MFVVIRKIDRNKSTNVWRYDHRKEFNDCIKYLSNNNYVFERLEKGDINIPDDIVKNCGICFKSLSSINRSFMV